MKCYHVMAVLFTMFGVFTVPVALIDGAHQGAMCALCTVMFGVATVVCAAIENRPAKNERK